MPPRDSINDLPDDNSSGTAPLSMVTVCLDRETQRLLKLSLSFLPPTDLLAEMKDYGSEASGTISEWIGSPPANICLVDFDQDPKSALLVSEQIHRDAPDTVIFAVSSDVRPEVIIQAMRSGCSEYLFKPLARDQLVEAVVRVAGRKKVRKERANGKVLTFIGAKGGCGVTTLVTQLGAILANSFASKTLLVDLHPNLGDAAMYLGFTNYRYHSFELIENRYRLDAELLQSLVLHHSSGLEVAPGPDDFDIARHIAPGAIAETLNFLRQRYEFILIDLPPGLDDLTQQLITHSDYVYLVTVAEVSAVRNVVRLVDYLSQGEITSERLRVVLNRFDKRSPIPNAQIEKLIRQKIYWTVPNQYHQVIKTTTGGDPAAHITRSELTRNLRGWAQAITGKSAAESISGKKRGGFMSLFGAGESS